MRKLKFSRASYAVAVTLVSLALGLVVVDFILRSRNEAPASDKESRVKTRIGNYVTERPLNALPIFLFWSLRKWSDQAACIADPDSETMQWDKFAGVTDIQVCLTRVLDRARTAQEVEAVLATNGFNRRTTRPRLSSPEVTEISAICGTADTPCGRSIGEFSWLFVKPYAFNLTVSIENHQVINVQVLPLSL